MKNTQHTRTVARILPSVCIIMCTYNASKFLREQIDSILAQTNVNINLFIRDDGSTDNTVALLKENYGGDARVNVLCGKNLGAAASFMEALFSCDLECEYYGFSDADDVWVADKMEQSIRLLEALPIDGVNAVVTRLQIVDQALRPLGFTAVPQRGLFFGNALVQTVASGAATAMNARAFTQLRAARPNYVVMHDAWVYLVITAFGNFLYSESSTILYRQHASNVIGTGHSWRKRMQSRVERLLTPTDGYHRQAIEFSRLFGAQLDETKKKQLRRFVEYRSSWFRRICFFLFPSVEKQKLKANLYMRFLILLGKE